MAIDDSVQAEVMRRYTEFRNLAAEATSSGGIDKEYITNMERSLKHLLELSPVTEQCKRVIIDDYIGTHEEFAGRGLELWGEGGEIDEAFEMGPAMEFRPFDPQKCHEFERRFFVLSRYYNDRNDSLAREWADAYHLKYGGNLTDKVN